MTPLTVMTMKDFESALSGCGVDRFTFYRGVMVAWDEDTDQRVLQFIDLHERRVMPWLAFIRERKGMLDMIWHDYIPTGFESGKSPDVIGDCWTINNSFVKSEIGTPLLSQFDQGFADHRRASTPKEIPSSVASIATKYGYRLEDATRNKANTAPATWKQISYIKSLSLKRPERFRELAELIAATWSMPFDDEDLEFVFEGPSWSKADAAFIIKCLLDN